MASSGSEIYLSVIIPAYNEGSRLGRTLDAARKFLVDQPFTWQVAVVDDGSSDQTPQLVEAISQIDPRVQLLQYAHNRGKGFAVRYGMLHTSGKYRLFMDADHSTAIDHISQFLPLLEADCDIVIASRALAESEITVHQPKWKESLGKLGNRWIQWWAVPGIKDTQAGFKAFRAQAAEKIFPNLTIDRWGFDVEVLALAKHYGYKVAEQPIRWVNNPETKVTALAYLQVLRDVMKVRFNIWRNRYPV